MANQRIGLRNKITGETIFIAKWRPRLGWFSLHKKLDKFLDTGTETLGGGEDYDVDNGGHTFEIFTENQEVVD